MFRWYRNAVKCYTYLVDVSIPSPDVDDKSIREPAWGESEPPSRLPAAPQQLLGVVVAAVAVPALAAVREELPPRSRESPHRGRPLTVIPTARGFRRHLRVVKLLAACPARPPEVAAGPEGSEGKGSTRASTRGGIAKRTNTRRVSTQAAAAIIELGTPAPESQPARGN